MYRDLSKGITDYLIPILQRMTALKTEPALSRDLPPGSLLLQHWSEIDTHLDQIVGAEMGVKLPEQKILFLKKVFSNLKDSGKIMTHFTWDNIRKNLADSTLQVWSETASKEGGTRKNFLSSIMQFWSGSASKEEAYQWDFLTGDDETLLINLMKSLDKKSDLLWTLWNDSKVVHLEEAKKSLYPCIKAKIESI
jgi:cyclopropane fatty-acyl-phospholipid synthase-like methyltransferase